MSTAWSGRDVLTEHQGWAVRRYFIYSTHWSPTCLDQIYSRMQWMGEHDDNSNRHRTVTEAKRRRNQCVQLLKLKGYSVHEHRDDPTFSPPLHIFHFPYSACTNLETNVDGPGLSKGDKRGCQWKYPKRGNPLIGHR